MKAMCYVALIASMLFTSVAAAQDDMNPGPPPAEEEPEGFEEEVNEPEAEVGSEDEAFLSDTEKAEIEAPEEEKDIGLAEDPDTPYFGVGLRVRWIMIPEWFIKMFGVDTARASEHESNLPLISNVGIGPEFIYRKGGFDITVAIWYAGLGWKDPISFKESGKGGTSWEVVTNDLHAILITADFLWSTSFTDWFAITYGAGLGLGIPWGDIIRTEATEASDGIDKCTLGDIDVDPWCVDGEEYGETYDKIKVVPWINALVGVRFKPHRHVAIYVDGGFGLGFQIGSRVAYLF
ncbi:MAG: hypothetical protein GY854_16190 [Deltaproteobacteria bacterium]|nr:hypothetical protein [Deltaproteobacteria bacterium]